jgi:hypothetical protein
MEVPVKTSHLIPFLGVLSLAAGACDPADDPGAAPGPDAGERCDVRYADLDGDRKGDPSDSTTACAPGPGLVSNSDDCDDTNPYINADEEEICDGVDNDCRATTGEATLCADQGCRSAFDPVSRTSYLFCRRPFDGDEAGPTGEVCRQHGFRPVQIETEAEDAYLARLIRTLAGPGGEGVGVLGGSYADGVWRWADGQQFWPDPRNGTPAPYAGWLDGEPGEVQALRCMGLYIGSEVGWVPMPCGVRAVIGCERASAP